MSLGPIRPRFQMRVAGSVDDAIARLVAAVASPESRCVSNVLAHHVNVTVVGADRHRWSPCMQLDFLDTDDGTLVKGLVGPHPNVWTLFALMYLVIATLTGFVLILGLVQLTLGQHAWGLWLVPVGFLLGALMYGVSQVGQRLAAEQTQRLFDVVGGALRPPAPAPDAD